MTDQRKDGATKALDSLDLITRREAAALLKVHTETVKRWQRAGRLKAYILSATVVRYNRADIHNLLRACAVAA